jgi:DNA-directed RNA polymerase subunit RPC12/RpoP
MTPKQIEKGLRAAVSSLKSSWSEDKTPARYSAAGLGIVCQHCGSDLFFKRQLSSVTYIGTMPVGDGLNRLHAVVCATCSRAELFASEPLASGQPTGSTAKP